MNDKLSFADTNILIYAIDIDGKKKQIALQLLLTKPIISIQVINECTNVLRKKFKLDYTRIAQIMNNYLKKVTLVPEIIQALKHLGQLAESYGEQIELVTVGGALMLLAYDARPTTKDIDVLITMPDNRTLVRQLAKQVAEERNLPEDWLNDAAKGYFIGLSIGEVLLDLPGIKVHAPSIEQALAMKVSAWRTDKDIDDALVLMQQITRKNQRKEEIWFAVQPFLVPGCELKAQYAFDELWRIIYGED